MCPQPAQGNGVVRAAAAAQSVNTHTSNSLTSIFKHTKCNFDHVLFSQILIITSFILMHISAMTKNKQLLF